MYYNQTVHKVKFKCNCNKSVIVNNLKLNEVMMASVLLKCSDETVKM